MTSTQDTIIFPPIFKLLFSETGSVPTESIAKVLETDEECVNRLAKDLGLRVPAKYNSLYRERGYITVSYKKQLAFNSI